jgi:hypothetical protein
MVNDFGIDIPKITVCSSMMRSNNYQVSEAQDIPGIFGFTAPELLEDHADSCD